MMKTMFLAVTAALAVATSVAAAPVSVSASVSHGLDGFTHVFTLTNDIGGSNNIYFFGVDLPGDIVGTPASWADTANFNSGWNTLADGGPNLEFVNTWCCASIGTPSGTSTTGFSVLSLQRQSHIRFFAYAIGGSAPNGDGHFGSTTNPGYVGRVSGTVPEPASWAMLIAGFGLVGIAARRRAKAAAA